MAGTKVRVRINEWIRIKTVRVIDEKGTQVGVIPTQEARQLASERGLDLVEVAPDANPPVCRILDYGKYKYQEHKKQQKAKKKHHVARIKEIRLRPLTGKHDVEIKLKHARKFLERGDKVTITMFFRGRERAHKDIGYGIMRNLTKLLTDVAKVEAPLKSMGPRLMMTFMSK